MGKHGKNNKNSVVLFNTHNVPGGEEADIMIARSAQLTGPL